MRLQGMELRGSLILAFSLSSLASAGTSPFSVSQLLEGYEKALSPFSCVTYTAESRSLRLANGKPIPAKKEYGVSTDPQGRAIFRVFYRRDSNRLDILSLKDGVEPTPDVWLKPDEHLERIIVDNSPTILLYANLTDSAADAVASKNTPPGFTTADSIRQEAGGNLNGGGPLDGFMPDRHDKTLPEILRGAKDLRVRPDAEEVSGHVTYVLECTDDGYIYQVWIDPGAGFSPRRIVQKRPTATATGTEVVVDDIQMGVIENQIVPIGAHTYLARRSGPASLYTSDSLFQRSHINFHPNFEELHAFKLLVRAGAGVSNEDFEMIPSVVKDGKFSPKVDATLIQSMNRTMDDLRASGSVNASRAGDNEKHDSGDSETNSFRTIRPFSDIVWGGRYWLLIAVIVFACGIGVLARRRSRGA